MPTDKENVTHLPQSQSAKGDEEFAELISEAMTFPEEQREARLLEIQQHQRFVKAIETRRRIIKQKNHRRMANRFSRYSNSLNSPFCFFAAFNDENIGLCSVCFDENFKVIYSHGQLFACRECINTK